MAIPLTGYFGVAIYHPKTEANIGTLWRSAKTYGAALLASVGPVRYEHQASDTCRAPQSVPLTRFSDIDDLVAHLPFSCPLVAVELSPDAKPLDSFTHPDRALYLLGAEDHGLPAKVLERCHHVVQIPSPSPWSLNVAVAGSLVMYDRYIKRGASL